jgi:uncharacterized RDD family membrane protein YckC
MKEVKKTFLAQASVLKRLGAFIIDLLIINIVILFPFTKLLEKIIPQSSFSGAFELLSADQSGTLTVVMLAISFLSILYFMTLEGKLGQTPGKMLFKLFVRGREKELRKWQLLVRSMFLIPVFPFVLLWIIDPVVMLFTKQNQRLSEILSKTTVVEKYKI